MLSRAARILTYIVADLFGLIVAITAAALFYFNLFDFARRPGGMAYFAAYLVVGSVLLFTFRRFGTSAESGVRS